MKLVAQRVSSASVLVDGEVVGKIGKGLFVLVGVGQKDTIQKADLLAEKLVKIRLMPDQYDKMNLSIKDVNGEILVVSQFTLYADTSGGNRPSFVKAAEPRFAKLVYERLIQKLRDNGVKVETGYFGNYMDISVKLDGPVTVILEN